MGPPLSANARKTTYDNNSVIRFTVRLSGLISNCGSSLNIEYNDISILCSSAIALILISGASRT